MLQTSVQYKTSCAIFQHILLTLLVENVNHLSQSHFAKPIQTRQIWSQNIQDDTVNSVMVQKLAVSPCQDRRSMDALMLPWQKFVQQDHKSMFSAKDNK